MNRLKDSQLKSLQDTCKSVLIEHNNQYEKEHLNEFFSATTKQNLVGGISDLSKGNIGSGVGQLVAGALTPLNPGAHMFDDSVFGVLYNKYVGPHTEQGRYMQQAQAEQEQNILGQQAHYDAHIDAVKNHLESIRGTLNASDPTHMPFLVALDHFDNGRDTHAMQILGLHKKLNENSSLQEQSPGGIPSSLLRMLSGGRYRRQGLIGVIGSALADAGDEATLRQLGITDLVNTIRGGPRAMAMRNASHNRLKQLGLS